jgi:hypothetical protein
MIHFPAIHPGEEMLGTFIAASTGSSALVEGFETASVGAVSNEME